MPDTEPPSPDTSYVVYVLRCRDGSLYTGIARDLERRLAVHRAGKGSRYVASRLPVEVVHTESAQTRADALRRESAIKRLSRLSKERLIGDAPSPPLG